MLARAVRDRERPLRRPLEVPYGFMSLHVSTQASARMVAAARRRPGPHNSRRARMGNPAVAPPRRQSWSVELRIGPRATGPNAQTLPSSAAAAAAPRRCRGPRSDVAGPHSTGAPPRPLRCTAPHRAGTRGLIDARESAPALPAAGRPRSTTSPGAARTSRCSTKPEHCSGTPPGGHGPTTPTSCAPTATSSSTKPRTCRPCSCA